jgi:hypothetical protein
MSSQKERVGERRSGELLHFWTVAQICGAAHNAVKDVFS